MKAREILLFLLATSILWGCAENSTEAVTAVVRAYNNAVIEAYRTGSAQPLLPYASEKEMNKVQVLVDLKMSNRLVLESELQSLELLSAVREPDDTYTVRTRERWKYFDRPLQVGVPPGPTFVADMFIRYTLRREGDRWKVQKLSAEKTEYLEGPKREQK